MESNNPGIHHPPASTHIPPQSSGGRSLFMEQANPPSGLGSELGWRHHEHLQNHYQLPQPQPQPRSLPLASTQSFDIQEAIQREIEKSRIREELIVQELMKRRMLESEVRRELMMERELALRQGGNVLSFGLPSSVRLPTMGSMAEGRFQGEGNMFPLAERMSLNGPCERDWYNDLPFQRATTNLMRISEVKSVSEGGKEKEKIILLAKPDEISGLKRKAGTPPPGADTSEHPSDNISRKRAKEEWSCAVCKVSATSEQGLQEHLEGKKHKAKEAKLRAKALGKNHSIGIPSKKPVNPIQVQGSVGSTGDALDVPLLPQKSSESGTDNQTLVPKSSACKSLIKNHEAPVQKSDDLKKKYKFWCEMCQVGAMSEKVMDSHKNGKKHLTRLQKLSQTDAAGVGQSNQSEQLLNHEDDCDNNLNAASEFLNGSELVDNASAEAVEPQDNETADRTTLEACAEMVSAELNDGLSTVPDTSNVEPTAC